MIRLVIIDDHRLFVDGMRAILHNERGTTLINGYNGQVDLQKMLTEDQPDVVLVDMYMPDKSGVVVAREIKSLAPHIKVILLSMEVDAVFVSELREIGVESYVSKELEAHELINIINKVSEGAHIYQENPLMGHTWLDVLSEDFHLTEREIEVLEYIKQGKTNKEIAQLTNRSVWTIMTHRRNIRHKIKLIKGR